MGQSRLGTLLRDRRQQRGLSLRDASRELRSYGLEVPASTLSRVERGILEPRPPCLFALLDIYDLAPERVAQLYRRPRTRRRRSVSHATQLDH